MSITKVLFRLALAISLATVLVWVFANELLGLNIGWIALIGQGVLYGAFFYLCGMEPKNLHPRN